MCAEPTGAHAWRQKKKGHRRSRYAEFVFTEEQQDLRDMVRRFLAEKSPVSEYGG